MLSYQLLRSGRWTSLALCCLYCRCVQSYVSPYKSPPTGYLVVEGFISGNTPTQYRLSRSIELPGDSAIPPVTGAKLQVEGSDNSVYPLPELVQGNYGGDTLNLSTSVQYRLRIGTPDGQTYLSDFVPLKSSPPIDSVNWVYHDRDSSVDIYVNTHDPANSTRYYRWVFDQTWEYHSTQQSALLYIAASDTVVQRAPDQQVFRCWQDIPSTSIYLSSTAKLANDVVYAFPLVHIPYGAQQLAILYSIQVTQYALTEDAYNFYTQLLENTESLGSIFDLLPTQLTGNIRNLTNPDEPVIGYISAGTLQQQRIFIYHDQLPYWVYNFECGPDIAVKPDSIQYYFGAWGFTPVGFSTGVYLAGQTYCVDCTSQGGSNQKPAYWPN